ncbi:MAG: endonuclease/exonuclease/phosphatase family protein [Phycisphaerales bacterium]|nr:endonuclease/exonuclease/phosphatase family protein [Phycisphaerales bacterium]
MDQVTGRFQRIAPRSTATKLALLSLLWPTLATADIRVATYNLLQMNSNPSVSRESALKTVLVAVDADVIVVQEISSAVAVNNFRLDVLNAVGGPGENDPYSSGYLNDPSTNTLDQAIFYRPSKVSLQASLAINTAPRDTYRWTLRPLSDLSGDSDLYIYAMHLSASDAGSRDTQTNTIRNNANNLPAGSHIIFAGDFNINTSTESSYQNFIESQVDNDGRGFDPINTPGNWSSNSFFAAVHTQSPHNNNPGAPGGAVGGGLDDRFDFLLISAALQDSSGLDYIANSYTAFGNDGLHFNDDINDAPIIPEGLTIANALHASSDHLPVFLDLEEPIGSTDPEISAPAVVPFDPVLVGTNSQADITVENVASPPGPDLEYSFAAPPDFTAPGGMFMASPGAGANMHTLTMLASSSGNKFGVMTITNNSSNDPMMDVTLAGAVFDHAVPSTAADNQVLSAPLDFGTQPIGGFTDQFAAVHNANFDPVFSVPLEVTSGTISDDTEGRFSIVGSSTAVGIEDTPVNFQINFDDTGASPGVFTATLEFTTQDDTTISGATTLDTVVYNLSATVSGGLLLGDLSMNGCVDAPDIPLFVALLLDPDGATVQDREIADMNADTDNDGLDLQLFVNALVAGCP